MNSHLTGPTEGEKVGFVDGSLLIIEASLRTGANVFVGYPITPSNLLYFYAKKSFPITLAAPDEITTIQWMAGFSLRGYLPITATSFPGFALMVEGINMAYMMELPMVIILVQRLGPSTGSATCGAQGDLLLLQGVISGGYPLPVLCLSNLTDCWALTSEAIKVAYKLRTPVVLLTSKEMVMTQQTIKISSLITIKRIKKSSPSTLKNYSPYNRNKNYIPNFLPVGNDEIQTRFTASTHNAQGLIATSNEEGFRNTRLIFKKITHNLKYYTYYEYVEPTSPFLLLLSYGVTAQAVREAKIMLAKEKIEVGMLIVKTLTPTPDDYFEIIKKYQKIVIVEENITQQYQKILFGNKEEDKIHCVGRIGGLISPTKVVEKVKELWNS